MPGKKCGVQTHHHVTLGLSPTISMADREAFHKWYHTHKAGMPIPPTIKKILTTLSVVKKHSVKATRKGGCRCP